MARTQVRLWPSRETRKHRAGRIHLGTERLQHPLHHLLGHPPAGPKATTLSRNMQTVQCAPLRNFLFYTTPSKPKPTDGIIFTMSPPRQAPPFPQKKKPKIKPHSGRRPSLSVSSPLATFQSIIFLFSIRNLYVLSCIGLSKRDFTEVSLTAKKQFVWNYRK